MSPARRVPAGKAFLTIYLDRETVERLDKLAGAEDMSRSKLVSDLLTSGLEDRELTVKVMTDPVVAPAMMSALAKPEILRALMGVMRESLSDEQLDLFQRSMAITTHEVEKHHKRQQRAAAKQDARPARSRRKKGKK
jgi:hypothetical protein